MTLPNGTRLGPYEILSSLGAGGMGEVYRAKDTRLDRIVAVKILASRFQNNSDLKQRFEREARLISSLTHPHICGLYDVGSQDGTEYLVMEFLEGETLADRLTKGPLPTDQMLRYAIQIGDALFKAHKQGIVHRDLKPGNIMLTKSGIKLLDFGLAKVYEASQTPESVSQLGTEQADLTAEGTIVGTIPYMSPEQLEGKELDSRSDIFSFGTVLYEMATGRKAFSGNSKASLISSILRDDPAAISTIQPIAPAGLDNVVKICLKKDPDSRWQSAQDVVHGLEWVGEGIQNRQPAQKTKRGGLLLWILLSVLSGALMTFALQKFERPKEQSNSIQFQVPPPPGTSFGGPSAVPSLAISPDGTRLAFIAAYKDKYQTLWIRDLNSLTSRSLEGTEAARYPFWSPDGQYVGFTAPGKILKVNPRGDPPQSVFIGVSNRGAAWSPQGSILFALSSFYGLYKISETGGAPKQITHVDHSIFEAGHSWPVFLPDGNHFLYFVLSSKEGNQIRTGDLSSGKSKLLSLDSNSLAVYSPPGYLLFVRGRTLMAQSFNPKTLELSGQPTPIAPDMGRYDDAGPTGYAPLSVSNNGVLAFGKVAPVQSQLVWVDRNGVELGAASPIGRYSEPALSPNEKQISVEMITQEETDIWLIETTRMIPTRLTNNAVGRASIWSPDGKEIVSISEEHGGIDLYAKKPDGSSQERLIAHSDLPKIPDDWSHDGRFLVYEVGDAKTGSDLWILPMTGNGNPIAYLTTEHNEENARFSPDGKWIAYSSDESGQIEIYVQAFGDHTGKWRVSSNGGRMPNWNRNGKELFYVTGDSQFMSVPIESEPSFKIGTPVPLFRMQLAELGITAENRTEYAVSEDGKRFLVNKRIEESTPSAITIITNWTQNLPR